MIDMTEAKSKKKAEPPKCPHCKVPIKNCKELLLKTDYACGSCSKIFFIEKNPSFFYNIKV